MRDTQFVLRTDHENLTYIYVNPKQKVQRWKLAIQHYDFDIEHIADKDNIIADEFSRFCTKPPSNKSMSVEAKSTAIRAKDNNVEWPPYEFVASTL